VSAGKHVVLADLRQDNADAAARTLGDAGFDVSTANVDVSTRASVQALVATATGIGEISGLIHAAGGASGVRGSTRSAPGSSSPRSRTMNFEDRAAPVTGA
jgi:NADP-dependent 3-hydroxy acid dehydrogenase YdfG